MDVPLFCQKGEGDSGTVTGCLVNKVRVTVHQGTVTLSFLYSREVDVLVPSSVAGVPRTDPIREIQVS